MLVNGIDLKQFGAKLLTVTTAPPAMAINYEMLPKALIPTEYDTDIPLGSLTLTVYFTAKNRAQLERAMSSFMSLFRASCTIEQITGYEGKYKGFLTADDYQKTLVNEKKILTLTFDGYFFDDDETVTFNGQTSGTIQAKGSRDVPCILDVTAKQTLSNYSITLNGNTITIETLSSGGTISIDGRTGTVTQNGANAFNAVDLWEFPKLQAGNNSITFSSSGANVKVTYAAMWL